MYLTKRSHKDPAQFAAADLAALSSSLQGQSQTPAAPIHAALPGISIEAVSFSVDKQEQT
jgi:hypothetical protein